MTVETILSNYNHENPGVRAGLRRLLGHGTLGGTGKLLILPVDQGFEHGPDKSFADNPEAYDPNYHVELACAAGVSAFASSLGMIESVAHDYAGRIPLILKLNHNISLSPAGDEPRQTTVALVESALTLGCSGVGFTIYPGSSGLDLMLEDLRDIIFEAKSCGLFVVVWSYPRGGDLSKHDETALDVICYSAHIAASLGANIIKVKLPSAYVRDSGVADKYRNLYGSSSLENMAERVAAVKKSCFGGRRLVVFSGGQKKSEDDLLRETNYIKQGGGDGSIIGRNVFQRPREESIKLLNDVMSVYSSSDTLQL